MQKISSKLQKKHQNLPKNTKIAPKMPIFALLEPFLTLKHKPNASVGSLGLL